jgi:signal transduction histidine kinase
VSSAPTASPTIIPPRTSPWPWVGLGLFFTTVVVALVFVSENGESIAAQLSFVVAFSVFGFVGALIASRDRGNVIGQMLLGAALAVACSFVSGELLTWMLRAGQEGPVPVVLGYANNFGWLLGFPIMLFLIPVLFPDGRVPSRRWRSFVWVVVVFMVLVSIGFVFGQQTLSGSDDSVSILNPLYIDVVGRLTVADSMFGVLFPVLFGLSILSLVLRYRRSSGVVRQQFKWVVFGLLVTLAGLLAGYLFTDPVLNGLVGGLAFLAFPIAIGVAVMRFRLYDLDVVVKKTVVYAALALFATLVYLALVVLLGAWVGRGNSLLTMVAAIVVALTFQPMRARITRVADRLVYGRRATPYEVLSEFGERLGETYAADDVLQRMARVLGEGVGADRATVWLRVGKDVRPVATWTPEGAAPATQDDHRVEVEHRGESLGALSVAMPVNDPIDPARVRLVSDLAAQAGLVLSNVRLTEELRARLDDLKAAQKRLVAAQDLERRRLERNIHDGAQQQLVALQLRQRLTEQLVDQDPTKAKEMLAQLQEDTGQALDDLRDLARGIYPPLLADKGLVAALEAQARKVPSPVEVRGDGVGRYPQETEAATYFSALEAMQNVVKYAEASRILVRLWAEDGALRFEVVDDGRGFDPEGSGYGTGLQGIADRLGALDGTLTVMSAPGAGTTIAGSIPGTPLPVAEEVP